MVYKCVVMGKIIRMIDVLKLLSTVKPLKTPLIEMKYPSYHWYRYSKLSHTRDKREFINITANNTIRTRAIRTRYNSIMCPHCNIPKKECFYMKILKNI